MLKFAAWLASVGTSFYIGMMYAGYYLVDVPDSTIMQAIRFVKTVKKVTEVFGS